MKSDTKRLQYPATFVAQFQEMTQLVDTWATALGWNPPPTVGEQIALMHSELSEALEGHRHHNPPSDHIPEFTAEEEEYADCIIRIMHRAAQGKLRIAEAIIAKHDFNWTRSFRHGAKKL